MTERLDEGLHRKLTLVSAPAGFGKTTLLSEWLSGSQRSAAWLSLDEGDNDPIRFLTYLVATLQTVAPNVGEGTLGVLQSPQPPPTESVLTALINEIAAIPEDFVFVFDDYHVIGNEAVDDALIFIIEHLPSQMHLVVATREDPQLPLARLRARGQLTELRAADLRFTPEEAAEFLEGVMGLDLSAQDIGALEDRTEGWIAGLQMAALSMQGREDIGGFIESFTGSHRFVLDYLIEEVLQQQSDRVRSFLLQTSVLDRLSGSLCDAVTGQEDGREMLEALERSNLFVVPLDDERQWYRYHHLFADVLRARLMEERPDRGSTLHLRASEWYEQNGLRAEAIHHAFAAEDFEWAASLIELAWPDMRKSRREATLLGWMKNLPDEVIHDRPVLSVGYAFALLDGGELEAAEARLRDAERWLDTVAKTDKGTEAPSAGMIVVDEEQFRSIRGSIANARAYLAQASGDVPGTVMYAQRALDLLPEDALYERGTAAAFLGLSYWASGDLEAAHRTFADGLATLQKGGGILFETAGVPVLAVMRVAQGRLNEAMHTYEQSLQFVMGQDESVPWITVFLHLGLGELHLERGDLAAAREHLQRSEEIGEQASLQLHFWRHRLCIARARIKEAQEDLDGALDLLDEAERLYPRNPLPDVRPIAALKVRLWIAQGRLDEAQGWVQDRGLSPHDDLSYMREFEHITLSRVLIAQYKSERVEHPIHEAVGLLERLLKEAEESERTGSVIEILLVQALAYEAQDHIPAALVPLERALTLAEPEGYVRLFVDEARPMARLLSEAATRGIMPNYSGKLLAAFEVDKQGTAGESPSTAFPSSQPLIEPLSQRELEILRLVAQGLSNRQISERLFLALSTVKGHNRIIFSKLMVQNRTEAVARARELGLL
ncbi:MAG: LuxR C-terminal-related transcriptional regulator [Rubrobacteraceae bacterium]